ncbi:MAG: rhodanese-like domain-containing protein [Gammaproteobacteria bacterium]|nr:rhodanese-like domain-containing protein [Gammaproteobacteria bacterium]MDH5802528.1 rhodanese-like domain-containing protein [Gammaproteobacteria bacterium]
MVSPGELQQILIQDNVLLLDVHVPKQKHIPGTDHHIAFYRIDENAHLYPADKTTPIYLYCESGPMANWAARSLHNLGYRNLISLDGGTHAWEKAGFALQAEATP